LSKARRLTAQFKIRCAHAPAPEGSFRTSYLLSRQGGEAVERSAKAIEAGGAEFEEVEIAEDLELLADFVGDVEQTLQLRSLR